MGYIAQWGPKGFLVSPEKIVTFEGFSTSIEMNDDSQNDTSGKAPTNTTGKKKQVINLSITYVRAAGVDPRAQFEEWAGLVGSASTLYIGEKQFGPRFLQLKKVDLSDLRLSNDGTFLMVTIAVSFEEYVYPSTQAGEAPLSSIQSEAAKTKTDRLLAEKEAAMATPPKEVREAMKPKGGGGGYKYKDDSLTDATW